MREHSSCPQSLWNWLQMNRLWTAYKRLRALLMMYICEASLGVWLHLHHYKLCNYSSSHFRHRHREYELQQQVSCLGSLPEAWVTVPDICSTLNCTLVISQHWTMAWASDKTNGQSLFKKPSEVRQWIMSLHKTSRVIYTVEESQNIAEKIFDSLNFIKLHGFRWACIIDCVFGAPLPPT